MMVLDTNVVSELMRANPEPKALAWMDFQNSDSLYLTSTIAAELLHGVLRLPTGIRYRNMAQEFKTMCLDAGFSSCVSYGDWRGNPYHLVDSEEIIFVATN